MLFRRRSRKDRIVGGAGSRVPPVRAVVTAAGLISTVLAALTAASSSVSAVRQKRA
jgi:hypothetical protein